jgi:homoserine dehydrogenase
VPTFSVPAAALDTAKPMPMTRHVGAYYIRLMVTDRPGVIADVTAAFRDASISLESMLQRSRDPKEAVPVVLVTHETRESSMRRALAKIAALDTVQEPPRVIRIEEP